MAWHLNISSFISSVRTSSLNIWTERKKKDVSKQTCADVQMSVPPPFCLSLPLLIFDHIPPASFQCYKYRESERERVSSGVESSEKDGWDEGWIEVGGGKWRESCKLWGVSLNETRCVTALMCMCATVWIYALLFSLQIGQIWNIGIWAADQEFSSWGWGGGVWGGGRLHRGPEGGSEWVVLLFFFVNTLTL